MTFADDTRVGGKRKASSETPSPPSKRQRRGQDATKKPKMYQMIYCVQTISAEPGTTHYGTCHSISVQSEDTAKRVILECIASRMKREMGPMIEIAEAKFPRKRDESDDEDEDEDSEATCLVHPDGETDFLFDLAAPKDAYDALLASVEKVDHSAPWKVVDNHIRALFFLGQKLERGCGIYSGGWSNSPLVAIVSRGGEKVKQLSRTYFC